jgi:hypothetical protein
VHLTFCNRLCATRLHNRSAAGLSLRSDPKGNSGCAPRVHNLAPETPPWRPLESVCVPESPNESCHQFAIAGALSSATIFAFCSLQVKLLYYPAGLWHASRNSCLSSRSKRHAVLQGLEERSSVQAPPCEVQVNFACSSASSRVWVTMLLLPQWQQPHPIDAVQRRHQPASPPSCISHKKKERS